MADTPLNSQSNVVASDQLSDSFAIMTDHQKRQKTNNPGFTRACNNIPLLAYKGDNLPGNISTPSPKKQVNQAAANLFTNAGGNFSSVRYGFKIDIFSSNPDVCIQTSGFRYRILTNTSTNEPS